MRNFICEKCGKEIFDSLGYVTECEHYPPESNSIESNIGGLRELGMEWIEPKDRI